MGKSPREDCPHGHVRGPRNTSEVLVQRKCLDTCLQVREYGSKVGSLLRRTSDRSQLLQTVEDARSVLSGVSVSDFQAVLGQTDVDSQFLAAVHSAGLTESQVSDRRLVQMCSPKLVSEAGR